MEGSDAKSMPWKKGWLCFRSNSRSLPAAPRCSWRPAASAASWRGAVESGPTIDRVWKVYARGFLHERGELHGFRRERRDFLEDQIATRRSAPSAPLVLFCEQHGAREELVHDAAQSPQVRSGRRQAAVQYFRRDVRARPAVGVAAASPGGSDAGGGVGRREVGIGTDLAEE